MMTTEYQHFGKYELHKRISRNANGEFWKGYDPELHQPVAIKVYYINQVDATFISRFAQRMGVLTSIHHANIVPIQDFYIAPSKNADEAASSVACIVMDYIEAPTLADYIRSTSSLGKLPPGAELLHLFTSLSLAIDYAHQNGIIHGHIKPSSILLGKNTSSQNKIGEPLLIDFELSGILQNSSSFSEPYYLAPEQIRGYPANERSDVYTLGIILYELCTGVLPFRGNRRVAIMMQHINALPTPPALLNPTISPALTNVIMRSLAKDPGIRFASASSMTVALAKALNMAVPENLVRSAYLLDLLSDSDATRPNNPVVAPRIMQPLHITSQFDRSTFAQNSWPWSGASIVEAVQAPEKLSREQVGRDHSSAASSRPTPITPIPSMEPFPFTRRRRFYKTLIIILIIFILLSSIITVGAILLSSRASPSNSLVGHAYLLNSGQLTGTTQGINSELQINLANIQNLAAGTSYYCWLLGDKTNTHVAPLLLGQLALNHGATNFLYPGDQQHDNLLGTYSRLLITVGRTNAAASDPLRDTASWRYYAEIPQTPIPGDVLHFSMLDHLRHLLVNSPELALRQIQGGPAIWLVRNTSDVLELANSAGNDWHNKDASSLRAQVIRILDYIDGTAGVQTDVPKGTPLLTDPAISQVALLGPTPGQLQPPGSLYTNKPLPGYIYLVGMYTNALLQAPQATPDQHQLVAQITTGLNEVKSALDQIHRDAVRLIQLNSGQLLQPASLSMLNDLTMQAQNAYAGQFDSVTDQLKGGVLSIYGNLQRLATFAVMPYTGSAL